MRAKRRFYFPLATCLVAFFFSSLAVGGTQQRQSEPPIRQRAVTSSQPPVAIAEADDELDEQAQEYIKRAETHYQKGEKLYKRGVVLGAQKEFEAALKVITALDLDTRSHSLIEAYHNELVEKINKVQGGDKADQKYEQSNLDEISAIDLKKEKLRLEAAAINPAQFDFEFEVTGPVSQFITYFTEGRGRSTMENGLRRSGRYRQMAEQTFREERVPIDLIWLAQVESVWKPLALSHAAAKGIWQFIPSTGLEYGLNQTPWLDERSNPVKQTRAAARYLRHLYEYFAGDWLLAMAAYNSGAGRVSQAIARSGYADFWEIHRRGLLPRETQNYVPAILATIVVAKNSQQYGFNVTPEPAWAYDTYPLEGQTDLRVIADLLDTSVETIQEYNPELRRLLTPPGSHVIRLPHGTAQRFALAYAALPEEQRTRRDIIIPYRNSERATVSNANYTFHRVSRGETLAGIARRTGTSQTELARLNDLRTNTKLQTGQTIRVPAKKSTYQTKSATRRSKGYASRSGKSVKRQRR